MRQEEEAGEEGSAAPSSQSQAGSGVSGTQKAAAGSPCRRDPSSFPGSPGGRDTPGPAPSSPGRRSLARTHSHFPSNLKRVGAGRSARSGAMPLLHRKPFVRKKPPADLRPDERVFYCRVTNEIFRDYE